MTDQREQLIRELMELTRADQRDQLLCELMTATRTTSAEAAAAAVQVALQRLAVLDRFLKSFRSILRLDENEELDITQGKIMAHLMMSKENPRLLYENTLLRDQNHSFVLHLMKYGCRVEGVPLVVEPLMKKVPLRYKPSDN